MTIDNANHIILFDGKCSLCHNFVRFVIKRDKQQKFKFASLQSEIGERLIRQYHYQPVKKLDSMLLVKNNKLHTRSSAVLEVFRELSWFWRLWVIFLWLPRWLRDPVYNFIGNRRYGWFGVADSCELLEEEYKSRFL